MLACGGGQGDDGPGRTEVPAASGAAAVPQPPGTVTGVIPAPGDSAALVASVASPCALFGLWQPCSVLRRLESAGLGPTPLDGAVQQPGLGVGGSVVRLGRGELQIFLYSDTVTAAAEAARLEPRDAKPARVRGIRRPPTVIHSGNLVALMFNNNDRQLERVRLALTAGLPAS